MKEHEDKRVEGETAELDAQRDGQVLHLDTEAFDRTIQQSEVPVAVDFWAEWCAPCHMMSPFVERLAAEYAGRAVVGKVDADAHPELLDRYEIMGIPTILFFKNGQLVDRLLGAMGYPALQRKLEGVLG